MSQALTANQDRPLVQLSSFVDPKAVIAQVQAVQQIMVSVMKEGVHYGRIPGTAQDSLYKQGAEALLSGFRIAVEPDVREIRDGDHVTYQVRCAGRHMQTGIVIGIGVGECSTAEDKYAWRAAVCEEEFDATPETHRRIKWNKGKWDEQIRSNGPGWSVKQVRTNPADLANTVLKMAKKRAMIDLCLTSLAASDIFSQDLEDLPAEYLNQGEPQRPAQRRNKYQEREKTGAPAGNQRQPSEHRGDPNAKATEPQVRFMRKRMGECGKDEGDVLHKFKLDRLEDMKRDDVNAALDFITGKVKDGQAGGDAGSANAGA